MSETKGRKACLLLHGFTGAPYEVDPLAKHLTAKGWDCFVPTLKGHGSDLRNLRKVKRKDWIDSAETEAARITREYGSFDLVGFSMSGLIAPYLANRYPVRRLVLLNAAVIYISPLRLLKNLAERILKRDMGYYVRKNATPFSAVLEFTRLVRELKPEFDEIQVPTLVVQGERDQVVHPLSARLIMSRLSGPKELLLFKQSRHLICLDSEAPEVFVAVERYLSAPGLQVPIEKK